VQEAHGRRNIHPARALAFFELIGNPGSHHRRAADSPAVAESRHGMAGSTLSDPAISYCLVNPVSKPTQLSASRPRDLAPAAVTPRRAAAATANAASATSAAAATPTTSAAAATAPGYLHAAANVFLVEQMERCQADVGDFLVAESDGLSRYIVRCLLHVRCRHCRCGCASHQRQSQSGGPQGRGSSFCHTLRLRSLLHSSHSRILQIVKNVFRVQPQ
jgi:hypothetical protein